MENNIVEKAKTITFPDGKTYSFRDDEKIRFTQLNLEKGFYKFELPIVNSFARINSLGQTLFVQGITELDIDCNCYEINNSNLIDYVVTSETGKVTIYFEAKSENFIVIETIDEIVPELTVLGQEDFVSETNDTEKHVCEIVSYDKELESINSFLNTTSEEIASLNAETKLLQSNIDSNVTLSDARIESVSKDVQSVRELYADVLATTQDIVNRTANATAQYISTIANGGDIDVDKTELADVGLELAKTKNDVDTNTVTITDIKRQLEILKGYTDIFGDDISKETETSESDETVYTKSQKQLNSKIESLKNSFETTDEKINDLVSMVTDTETSNVEMQAELASVKSELYNVSVSLNELSESVENISQSGGSGSNQGTGSGSSGSGSGGSNDKENVDKESITSLKEQIAILLTRVEYLEKLRHNHENQDFLNQLDESTMDRFLGNWKFYTLPPNGIPKSDLSSEVLDVMADVDNLGGKINFLKESISSNSSRISSIEATIGKYERMIVQNQNDIKVLQSEVKILQEKVETNKENIKTNKENIETNKNDIKTNKENIETNQNDIKTLQTDVDTLSSKVSKIDDMEATINKLKEAVVTLGGTV